MSSDNEEVRVTHLHPRAFRSRLSAMPVAWLPLGTIEWHGFHLPLGFDGVKAELLCQAGAREIGGVVFPVMYYGDHRGVLQEGLFTPALFSELTYDHRAQIAEELGGQAELHASQGTREQHVGAMDAHVELLLRAFWSIRAYGFTRIVALAGHYPIAVPLGVAIRRFHDAQSHCQVLGGTEEHLSGVAGGDHAARYETSQMLHLDPKLVHLDELPAGDPLGVRGIDPRQADRNFGEDVVTALVAALRPQLAGAPPMGPFGDHDEDRSTPDWPRPLEGSPPLTTLFKDPRNTSS